MGWEMTNSPVPCAWWHTPSVAIKPLEAIKVTVQCLESGQPVPTDAAHLVAVALRQYLAGQHDITKNLGLRPRRGGRYEVPAAIERTTQRNAAIKHLASLQDGPKTARCQKVADMLKAAPLESRVTESEVFGYVMQLHQEFGGWLPTSMRQILRIVDDK